MAQNLIYALKDSALLHISDVERGLKCGCTCPACEGALVARKGMKKSHHFAHKSAAECEYGYETSLHMAAKQILAGTGKMWLPKSLAHVTPHKDVMLRPGAWAIIEQVELEKRYSSVIPDVIIHTGGETVFVEIYVTHRIDDEKLEKLKTLGISTIEIDLSQEHDITREELSDILLGDSPLKYWKYYNGTDSFLEDMRQDASRHYTDAFYVYSCPMGVQYEHYECLSCDHAVGYDDPYVLCNYKEPVKRKTARHKPVKKSGPAKHEPVKDPEEPVLKNPEKPRLKKEEQAPVNQAFLDYIAAQRQKHTPASMPKHAAEPDNTPVTHFNIFGCQADTIMNTFIGRM